MHPQNYMTPPGSQAAIFPYYQVGKWVSSFGKFTAYISSAFTFSYSLPIWLYIINLCLCYEFVTVLPNFHHVPNFSLCYQYGTLL